MTSFNEEYTHRNRQDLRDVEEFKNAEERRLRRERHLQMARNRSLSSKAPRHDSTVKSEIVNILRRRRAEAAELAKISARLVGSDFDQNRNDSIDGTRDVLMDNHLDAMERYGRVLNKLS